MPLFVGEFELTIDNKNRLAIPAALREQCDPDADGRDFYLVLGPDMHLWLYPHLYYSALLERRQGTPFPNRRDMKRHLWFRLARVVKPDAQGRFVIPPKSMERATIDKRVTLLGTDDHIEVWPTDEWESYVKAELPSYGENLLDAGEGIGPISPGGDPQCPQDK
ncbi:hypothetical protein LCGC14_2779470 [marine sediment metagenome]|uniref:Transcriptional regulator MraZ n=1 Tax=marine sediment metagenome TaxID=412755 RepID=A0A0F8YTP1_9ZZZZ